MRFKKILQLLHIPLWVIKDLFWMIGWSWLSLALSIPAILVSILIVNYTAGIKKLENYIIFCWLTANTLWLMDEKLNAHTHYFSLLFFLLGLGVSIKYIKESLQKD
jgi:4-amino-4-deoxy-L-arabinose transferase-like glycosyltransferase